MKSGYWLVLAMVAVCTVQSIACSSKFDSCIDTRTCPEIVAGGGGEAGATDAGAPSMAGSSERDDEGGAGGSADPQPTLFGACSKAGAVACADAASSERLACNGTQWQQGASCGSGLLCDSSTGKCAPKVAECEDATPGQVVCRGDAALTCGPDLVTAELGDECTGRCKVGKCQTPTCGDEKLEAGEECDEAVATTSGTCVSCKKAVCGDGSVYAGHEQCDDHNTVAGDGCSASCTWEPIAVAAGRDGTCVLSASGAVKCWGANDQGQLGLGDSADRGDGPNEMGNKLPMVALGTQRTAQMLASSSGATCALLDDHSLKCWGINVDGVLGTGDRFNRGSKPGQMGDALMPIAFGAKLYARSVTVGQASACAVLDTGAVKCWGAGLLGQGDDAEHLLPSLIDAVNTGGTAKAVATGVSDTSCVLLETGAVKCWGNNVKGVSSWGSTPDSIVGDQPADMELLKAQNFGAGHTAKAIAVGNQAACAILEDETLKCWGWNVYGKLGQGHPASSNDVYGTTSADLAALPVVDLGAGAKVKSVSMGLGHTCALLDGGRVKCWGLNVSGQLGQGHKDALGDGPGEMGSALQEVALGTGRTAIQISTGNSHTCALLDNGAVKCWGSNIRGQLGLGDIANRGAIAGQMGDALPAIDLTF